MADEKDDVKKSKLGRLIERIKLVDEDRADAIARVNERLQAAQAIIGARFNTSSRFDEVKEYDQETVFYIYDLLVAEEKKDDKGFDA